MDATEPDLGRPKVKPGRTLFDAGLPSSRSSERGERGGRRSGQRGGKRPGSRKHQQEEEAGYAVKGILAPRRPSPSATTSRGREGASSDPAERPPFSSSKPSSAAKQRSVASELVPVAPGRRKNLQDSNRPKVPLLPSPQVYQLIEETWDFDMDTCYDVMSDNDTFTVVSVVGEEGSGKSSLLNYLAGCRKKEYLFAKRKLANRHADELRPTTKGIQLGVIPEGFILLDTQPVLSSGMQLRLMKKEIALPAYMHSYEHWSRIQSFQTGMFAFAVSHIVIVTLQWPISMDMMDMITVLEMLNSRTPHVSSSSAETRKVFYPDIVFVVNNVPSEQMNTHDVTNVYNYIDTAFTHSKFRREQIVSMENVEPCVKTRDPNGLGINFFALPEYSKFSLSTIPTTRVQYPYVVPMKVAHDPYDVLRKDLVRQLLRFPKVNFLRKMSSRDW